MDVTDQLSGVSSLFHHELQSLNSGSQTGIWQVILPVEQSLWPYLFFETQPCCFVAQAGLELTILLPQPPKRWGHRHTPPHLDSIVLTHPLIPLHHDRLCEHSY